MARSTTGKKKNRGKKEIRLTKSEVNRIKKAATKDATIAATTQSFVLSLAVPAMVIQDHYNKLTRKEVEGKGRAERLVELCLNQYECIMEERVNLAEIVDQLIEDTGVDLRQIARVVT